MERLLERASERRPVGGCHSLVGDPGSGLAHSRGDDSRREFVLPRPVAFAFASHARGVPTRANAPTLSLVVG